MNDVSDASSWLSAFAGALLYGLQAALPALIFVALAGLLASFLQTLIGYGDVALGLSLRLVGVILALVFFGGWMATTVLAYWHWADQQLLRVVGTG
jgi:type III secretory pathway component EscS